MRSERAVGAPTFVPMVVPWSIDLAPSFANVLDDVGGDEAHGLRARLGELRTVLFQDLGLPLPSPRVAIHPDLPETGAVISVREVPVAVLQGTADEVVAAARAVLAKRAHELLGIGETQLLLDALEEVNPALVRQLVPKPIPVTLLAEVLRRLLEEQVGIRDLRTILEGIAPVAAVDKDPLALAETARAALRRAITHRLTGGAGALPVLVLEPVVEDTVRGAITRTTAGAFLTLAPSAARDVVRSIARALSDAEPAAGRPDVLLASPDVRRFFRKLVETELPELQVVSFAELEPELRLETRGRVGL